MVVDMEVNKVANEVADMEMDMVADIEVDKVLGTKKSCSWLDMIARRYMVPKTSLGRSFLDLPII